MSKPLTGEEMIVHAAQAVLEKHKSTILSTLSADFKAFDAADYDKLVVELFSFRFGISIFACTEDDGECDLLSSPLKQLKEHQYGIAEDITNSTFAGGPVDADKLEQKMLTMIGQFFTELFKTKTLAGKLHLPVYIVLHDEGVEHPLPLS